VRLFVALEIPPAVRDNLATLIKDLRTAAPKARWVRPENIHVTLNFIGEVAPEKLTDIRGALSDVQSERAVELKFRGLGFFPNAKRPSVLWVGIDASPNLQLLAGDIERSLEKLGFPREERPFVPHLTITRFQPPRIHETLQSAIAQNSGREFGFLRTCEFHLIESKLKPSGAEYTTLASFHFAAAEA
jgi:RNA 2',3'-cyclic 3'-phosphodiesterase